MQIKCGLKSEQRIRTFMYVCLLKSSQLGKPIQDNYSSAKLYKISLFVENKQMHPPSLIKTNVSKHPNRIS